MKKKSTIKEWIKAILLAFVTIVVFRGCILDVYTIPSSSMEKTLLTGDFILVSKLSYGIRLPITPLSFPFAHQRLPFTENTKSYLDWVSIPYTRLFGSPDIERNDIVVFNFPIEDDYPIDQKTYYIKRCVAISGDTIEVRTGQVYINGKYNDLPEKLQFTYKVETDTAFLNLDSLKKKGFVNGDYMRKDGEFWFTLNLKDLENINKISHVKSVEPLLEKKGQYNDYMFPADEHFLWNVDFFGPVYVPKKGDSVKLSIDSLPLYERIIKVYEKNDLRVAHDSIFINNKYATHYTFKMNYFFMMGDNRHNSADSRFWGFVPEDHVVGKTVAVLMSINKTEDGNHIRWNRWFKGVD